MNCTKLHPKPNNKMPILPVLLGGRPLNGVGCLYHDGAIALLLSFYLRGVHEKVLEFAFLRSLRVARSFARSPRHSACRR